MLCLDFICYNISFLVGFFVQSDPQHTMHWFNTIVGFLLISIYLPGTFTCFCRVSVNKKDAATEMDEGSIGTVHILRKQVF